jgi:hypothetical protein
MTTVRTAVTAALVLAFALAGCGGSSGESEADKKADKQLRTGNKVPKFVCADKAKEQPKPKSFPADFPLPAGSVVIGSEERDAGRVIVYAVSPADVKATLAQMQKIPDAGFKLTEGEVEERDAESNWEGNGYVGRWAIREIDGCTDQTSVTVLAQEK